MMERNLNELDRARNQNRSREQYIQKQVLISVDKTYSCNYFGHLWDYNFKTYDNQLPMGKVGIEQKCFCGATRHQN